LENQILLLVFLSILKEKKSDFLIENVEFSPNIQITIDSDSTREIDFLVELVNNHNYNPEKLRKFEVSSTEAAVRLKHANFKKDFIKKVIGLRENITLYEYNGGIFPFDLIENMEKIKTSFNFSLLFIDYQKNKLKTKISSNLVSSANHLTINKVLNLFYNLNNQIIFTHNGTKLINNIKSHLKSLYDKNDFLEYSSFYHGDEILTSFFSKRPSLSYIDLPYKLFHFKEVKKDIDFNKLIPLYTSSIDLKDNGIIIFDLIQLPLLLDYILRMINDFLEEYEIKKVLYYSLGGAEHSDSSIRNSINVILKTLNIENLSIKKQENSLSKNSKIQFFHKDNLGRLFKTGSLEINKNSSIYYMDKTGKEKEALTLKFSLTDGITSFLGSFLESSEKYCEIKKNKIFIIPSNSKVRGESFKLQTLFLENGIDSELYGGRESSNKVLRDSRKKEYSIIIVVTEGDIILHHDTIYHFGMDYLSVLEYLMEKKNG
jgi:hypothetical protein